MRFNPLPPLEQLQEKLYVCKNSPSGLRWKKKGTRGIKPGDMAGKQNPSGYWQVRFNRKSYYAHRIVFYLVYKKDPMKLEVDHIKGKENPILLRCVTSRQNNYNLNKRINSFSKYKGVRKKRNKWQAGISIYGKYKNLGIFEKEEDAALAYNKAAKEIFGEYANINLL